MTDTDRIEIDLDRCLSEARDCPPAPPADLAARVLADAMEVQAGLTGPAPRPQPRRPGLWQQLVEALGGWPALGGLAAACAAGVWMGVSPPQILPDPVTFVQNRMSATSDLDVLYMGALDLALAEEE